MNNQHLIDNWTDHTQVTDTSAPISLVAGNHYAIRLEFYDHLDPAIVKLSWTYPAHAEHVIPQSRLFPAPPPNQPPVANV